MSICQIYDLCAETLWLGRYGENSARDIAIDVGRWFADLGTEGTVVLVNWRPGEDDTPYNPNVTMDGSKVVWSPSNVDLAISGRGFAELRYYVGNALAKSKTFRTVIDRTPSEGANPPSAAEDWVERMEDAAVTAQTASETAVSAAETATEGAQAVAEALPTVTQAAQTASSAATTATNAATEAAASEEVASVAANAAQTASETATAASQTAVGSASTATTKAAQAVEAASTATAKASEATQAATTATANAQTSTAKAEEATTAAATATSKATEAASAASTASAAATTATGAASTATSAASTATAAKTAAQTAQTGAETAQGVAEQAAASVTASAEQIETNKQDITELKADFSQLPTDGVTANSKQLLSSNGTDNTEPYLFRAVPANADREKVNAVVGGTVAWNQVCPIPTNSITETVNGITLTDNRDGTYTLNGTATDTAFFIIISLRTMATHKFALTGCPSGGSPTTYCLSLWGQGQDKHDTGTGTIWDATENAYRGVRIRIGSGTTINNLKFKPNLIDLTQLFGSTIADYIYNLEQSTAGAGVAWFRKLFPKDYYPYDAGTLKHVEGLSSHDTVGFNQWDADNATLYLAYLANTAIGVYDWVQVSDSRSFAIRCFPNTTYCVYMRGTTPTLMRVGAITADSLPSTPTSGGWSLRLEKAFVNVVSGRNKVIYTTGNNATYLIVQIGQSLVPSRLSDLCINLSWSGWRNGEYEPYAKHSYQLDSSLTLRGIPKLVDGKLTYDGDKYLPDGTVERRYGIRAYQSGDESLANAITDGANTVYKLTTPAMENATPYQSLQVCDPNGTEEFVSTGIVPVGHETFYPENLRAKIEGLPWDFSALIAPTETGTASRNYTVGSLLIMDNVLYKVTANIANGGTITPGTNVTATTLSEVISALQ